jgi:hypothetical protein
MSIPVFDPTKLKIHDCRTVAANVLCQSPIYGLNAQSKFNVELTLGTDYQNGFVKASLILDLKVENPNTKEIAGFTINNIIVFNVAELLEFISHDSTGNPILDAKLAYAIVGIAYSTSRGMISTQINNTFLSGFIMPVIDVHTLLQAQLVNGENN